mgnify:CR=1 FL=1
MTEDTKIKLAFWGSMALFTAGLAGLIAIAVQSYTARSEQEASCKDRGGMPAIMNDGAVLCIDPRILK